MSALIDYERSACLCDVGAPGYAIAVCVNDDGSDALWLVSVSELDSARPVHGDANQRHERVGRLPQNVRDRIWGDDLRCGRPRSKTGEPCRARVSEPGEACGVHREAVQP
jgi:hypothetical protein